ncbi:FAD-dependent oxidoreductase [Legionella erythra]|uniref:Pyridine nucleotide-disulfide oxidoreductase n=1 Tax=Legionella erythra TaxID=448 RepID=A0A0W0TU35_LEGER|nr:hypothetical protein [Legionella erythra]KTC99186.1 Pyridine nucleotide-disulfide oxidoreductase [Legionella erythra]
MKTIAIVGGGPAGLYLAIRLSQVLSSQSSAFKIVIIEPKFDDYNRPGIVAKNVLDLIERHIKLGNDVLKASDDSDSSIFISRLESALYKQALHFPIQFVKASLTGIDVKGRLTLDNGEHLSCDYAFDCTGARRKLISSVNTYLPSGSKFTFSQVADNPTKNHFVAYVTMDESNAALMKEDTRRAPLRRALGLQRLRSEFNWPEFVEPELSQRRYTHDKSVLFYLYLETPPHFNQLPRSKQKEWLNALIEIKTGHALEYTVEDDPLKFSAFIVDPDKVNETYLTTTALPFIVIPMGDAHIKPDFRLGIGIRSGVLRTETFITAFVKSNGDVPQALKIYEFLVREPLGWHEQSLRSEYRLAKEKMQNALLQARKMYMAAFSLAQTDIEKQTLEAGFDDINAMLGLAHIAAAKEHFAMAAHDKSVQRPVRQIRLSKTSDVLQEEALRDCEQELLIALKLMPVHKQALVKDELLDLAMSYKDVAGRLFQHDQKAKAKIYYKAAANLFESFFSAEHSLELVKIYSNLLIIAKQQQQYNLLEEYQKMASQWLKKEDMTVPEIKTLHKKINFNYCEGILTQIENEAKKETPDKAVLAQLEEAEKNHVHLQSQNLLSEVENNKLVSLLGKIKENSQVDASRAINPPKGN